MKKGSRWTRSARSVPAATSWAPSTRCATAAALLQRVALRSPAWPEAAAAHSRAEALRLRAEELIELDSLAFLAFLEAVRSGGDVEAARQQTIDVPTEIARSAAEVVRLAHDLESKGNPNLRADATAAAILAEAAARTAEMLVRVNESAGPRAARVRAGGPGRAPGRSRDSGPPS